MSPSSNPPIHSSIWRARICAAASFLTESETGEQLCLRPEFTIPVCLDHIASRAGTPRRYAYLGEVFRQRRDGEAEFFQAGLEDLGDNRHRASADARSIADAHALLTGRPARQAAGHHAGRSGDLRGSTGRARPAARLAHAAGPRLRLARTARYSTCRSGQSAAQRARCPPASPVSCGRAISRRLPPAYRGGHGRYRPVAFRRPHADRHRAPACSKRLNCAASASPRKLSMRSRRSWLSTRALSEAAGCDSAILPEKAGLSIGAALEKFSARAEAIGTRPRRRRRSSTTPLSAVRSTTTPAWYSRSACAGSERPLVGGGRYRPVADAARREEAHPRRRLLGVARSHRGGAEGDQQ
jgi:ATP phosphoribosyltransferase regulatory subunit